MKKLLFALSVPALTAGCASMTGLDGESRFACRAPDGVTCHPLSNVYAHAVANNLAVLRQDDKPESRKIEKAGEIIGRAPSSGDPIRTQPKVLRVWIAPWEDSDGDLHDQSYIYVVANTGRWVIEHNQKRIVDRYRPTFLRPEAQKGQARPTEQRPGTGVVLPGAQAYRPEGSGKPEELNTDR